MTKIENTTNKLEGNYLTETADLKEFHKKQIKELVEVCKEQNEDWFELCRKRSKEWLEFVQTRTDKNETAIAILFLIVGLQWIILLYLLNV